MVGCLTYIKHIYISTAVYSSRPSKYLSVPLGRLSCRYDRTEPALEYLLYLHRKLALFLSVHRAGSLERFLERGRDVSAKSPG